MSDYDSKNVIITNDNLKILIDTVVSRVNDNTDKKFAEVKSDIAVLQSDVSVLKTDIAILKTDVAVLKTDVAILKTDVAVLKTDVKRIERKVDYALEKQNKYDDTFHNIGQLVNNI